LRSGGKSGAKSREAKRKKAAKLDNRRHRCTGRDNPKKKRFFGRVRNLARILQNNDVQANVIFDFCGCSPMGGEQARISSHTAMKEGA
jgi:hypothetical protein